MHPFEEWAKTIAHPCVQKWSELLVELGASWQSFDKDQKDVVNDLVKGGIPLLAARDIAAIASEAIARSHAPLAIFWDLENMPIPTATSGRLVASRLKDILSQHGNLVQFRGYASIGLGQIPQQKRSDLHLSGCHLVDCPHNGRQEVADKMIIVDAMQFAFEHQDGATLCFITSDNGYAYLLATLQRPQWKTIVISKGTFQSMLHVNCDTKMCWETDILQIHPQSATTSGPVERTTDCQSEGTQLSTTVADDNSEGTALSFEAPTEAEEWIDDVELLRTALQGAPIDTDCMVTDGIFARKADVGSSLRQTNPARFPNRKAIQDFLSVAIERGVVRESGDGAFKTLFLPGGENNAYESIRPIISLSDQIPKSVQGDIPERMLEMTAVLPFMLFTPWSKCPKGGNKNLPSKTFVQSCGPWAVLMFRTLKDAQRAVAEVSWLCIGTSTLVDWRRVDKHNLNSQTSPVETIPCSKCKELTPKPSMAKVLSGTHELYCKPCYKTLHLWEDGEKECATSCVVYTLEWMAKHDDIYIPENTLRKQICLRWPLECKLKQQAAVWIAEAADSDKVLIFKRHGIKTKQVCLPVHYNIAISNFPYDEVDLSTEVKHVLQLLCSHNGWMDRTDVIASLKETFDTMQGTSMRNAVFRKAAEDDNFFLQKGPFGQTVGLTREDALKGLQLRGGSMTQEPVIKILPSNNYENYESEAGAIIAVNGDAMIDKVAIVDDKKSIGSENSSESEAIDITCLMK